MVGGFEFLKHDIYTVILDKIKSSLFISYGIVKSVPVEGVVEVDLVVNKNNNVTRLTCTVLHYNTKNVEIESPLQEGDLVLVLSLNLFDSGMFTTDSVINNKNAVVGYSELSCVAIPMGICAGEAPIKISFTDEEMKLDFDDEKLLISGKTDGSFSVKNDKVTISVDTEENVEISNSKGNIKLTGTNGSVTINGNLEVLV